MTTLAVLPAGGAFAGGALGEIPAAAERSVRLRNAYTGEVLETVFWSEGGYTLENLGQIYRLFRDHRTGEVLPIDIRLIELLHRLQAGTETEIPIDVVSGYRSPRSNQLLRRRTRRVARNSLHIQGMAADIRIPDKNLKQVHKFAVSLKAGGVGYYRRSGFLHVDVGPVRYWS